MVVMQVVYFYQLHSAITPCMRSRNYRRAQITEAEHDPHGKNHLAITERHKAKQGCTSPHKAPQAFIFFIAYAAAKAARLPRYAFGRSRVIVVNRA
jgi:hypothetical protein